MSTNTVYTVIMTILIDGQQLSILGLLGLLSGLVGSSVIAVGDRIKDKLCGTGPKKVEEEDKDLEKVNSKENEDAVVVVNEVK